MAEDLHPNWHRTDSASAASNTTPPAAAHIPLHGVRASRLPGAIAGIALVLALGFVFFRGVSHIRGQLLEEITMTISPGTVDPANITARPGQQIAWLNRDQLPHIIVSQSLCSASAGTCLGTDIFFEGSTMRYTIPIDAPRGTHTFSSEIDPTITGTITVAGESVLPAEEPPPAQHDDTYAATEPLEDSIADPDDQSIVTDELPEDPDDRTILADDLPAESGGDLLTRLLAQQRTQSNGTLAEYPAPWASGNDAFDIAPDQQATELALTEDGVQVSPRVPADIPRNPYTVGSPLTAAMQPAAGVVPLHGGAPTDSAPPAYQHRPVSQPETGNAATLAIMATVVIGGYAALRTLRKSTVVLAQ